MYKTIYIVVDVLMFAGLLLGISWHFGKQRKEMPPEKVKSIDTMFRTVMIAGIILITISAYVYHQEIFDSLQ